MKAAEGTDTDWAVAVKSVNELFSLLTLNSKLAQPDIQFYDPDKGTRRTFVKDKPAASNIPMTRDDKILCANGQFILLFKETTNRVSVWDFTVGKRFNLPTLPDSANHQIRIGAVVFCTDSTKGTHRIILLGTSDEHTTEINYENYEKVVTVWNLLEDYKRWDVRCNKSKKMKGFDPRSMALYKDKIWMAMEYGEIFVSDDTQDTSQELHAVPTFPNNLEAVTSAQENKMDLDYPCLPSARKSGPDYAFSGFVHFRDGLYLLANFVVYMLWEATDVLGRVSYTFRQTKDIEGATFIV